MKKLVALSLALCMTLSLAACGKKDDPAPGGSTSAPSGSTETVTLKLGHGQTEAHPYHTGAVKFAELVDQYTEGRVKIEIYPNATLGAERDMVEGCQMNTVDICITTNAPLTNFDAKFNVYEFPYLFETRDEAHKIMDGQIGQDLLDDLTSINIKGLAYFENGFRNVTNDVKPIVTVSDLAGMKIRTMESNIHIAAFRAMGANPTPMSWGDVYTSIQQHTIDGQENPPMAVVDGKIYEVNHYMSKTEHFYSPAPLVMSLAKFNALSWQDQEALLKAAQEAALFQRDAAGTYNEEKLDFLTEQGMKINEVDKTSFMEATASVYEEYADQYGDSIQAILKELGRA